MRTALIFALLPLPAFADSIFGEWCADEGWPIGIEAAGMGNFEHTFCEFDTPQTDGPTIATPMTCRSTYFDENSQPVVLNENRFDFTAELLDGGRLQVDYADGKGPAILTRCEG